MSPNLKVVIVLAACSAGCNLFSRTQTNDGDDGLPDLAATDDAGEDVGGGRDIGAEDVGTVDHGLDSGTDADASAPTAVWADIAAGGEHTCALTAQGDAYCWGLNDRGQLGNGGSSARELEPVAVAAAPQFVDLEAGVAQTCALDVDGALWCWGAGEHFGAAVPTPTPLKVADGPFKKMSVGNDAVCVIDANDLVKCVGENDWGHLGLPTDDDVLVLTDLGGAQFEAIDVALGNEFTCALAVDGTVTCFGRDLAYEPDSDEADGFLTQEITLEEELVALQASESHACGETADGEVYCWGDAPFLENLSLGGTATVAGRVPNLAALSRWVIGNELVCGLDESDIPYCLGSNYRGRQGKGTDNPSSEGEPLARMSTEVGFRSMSFGPSHGCAVTTDDTLVCWGQAFDGRLGNGEVGWRTEPVAVDSQVVFRAVATGHYHTCGLDDDQTAHCWGRGAYSALGNGGTEHQYAPDVVAGLQFEQLIAEGSHTCGRQLDGTVYCWGTDTTGVLGNASGGTTSTPDVVQGSEPFATLSTFIYHSCGIGIGGTAYCWGNEANVGSDVSTNRSTPYPLDTPDHPVFVQLDAGEFHSCGIDGSGAAFCFGLNARGQLGNGTTNTSSYASVPVSGGHTFRLVRAGERVSCGITADDELYCWGEGGLVGDGTQNRRTAPVRVAAALSWSDVQCGSGRFCCGLTTAGSVYCWGTGDKGRLGTGGLSDEDAPTEVALPETTIAVSPGGEHGCAVGESGQVYCWGSKEFGRLGDGDDSIFRVPTDVSPGEIADQ